MWRVSALNCPGLGKAELPNPREESSKTQSKKWKDHWREGEARGEMGNRRLREWKGKGWSRVTNKGWWFR